jgi:hypothetical protein
VDRALDLDRIRLALGDHARLPSARELVEKIAETEVALFRGLEEIDASLLDVAWYLHSVASALPALDLYGADRQRTAFQVSGHVFDLLLANRNLPTIDRFRFMFAAQVAYLRGDLNPNAIAAYRSRPDAAALVGFQDPSAAVRVGSGLLAFDTAWLFPAMQRLRRERDAARLAWGVDPEATVFGSSSLGIDGAWHLLLYLVYGSADNLTLARDELRRAVTNSPSSEDLDARWVAFHLLQLSDQLGATSLWSVLPPTTSPSIARAFTLARPAILSFWPPQVDLLRGDRAPNAFDADVRRMVLSIPTSAGKTLLAQVIVADHLARRGTGVCFVAPTRSLCREIEASLRRRLRLIATAAEITVSDVAFEIPLVDEVAIEVMTPERLAYLMRADPDTVLARYGLFIIDEAHTLTDGARGWTLEWVLSTLHHLSRDTGHRIVVMSAALGQRAHLVSWLDPTGEGIHFHSDWRGPRRVHSVFTSEPDWDHPRDLPRPRSNTPVRREYDAYGVLRLRPSGTGRIHQLRTTSPVGRLVLRQPSQKRDDQSTPFYKTLAPLASILGRAGPVLIISPTKVEAARLASEIAQLNPPESAAPVWLIDLAAARLGDLHPLIACLRRGVAYHHASLPGDVLLGIEEALSADELRFIVATTTLTEGVNLPVRTVIIAAQGAFSGEGYEEFITGARLLNAIGRAGRAARESEGWVVLARNAAFDAQDFERLRPTEADMPVQSVLVSDPALDQLASLEAALAGGADVALARPGPLVEGFLSYVWYVASLLEDRGQPATPDSVSEFLRSTLAWRQLDDQGRRRWHEASRAATVAFRRRPADARRRWSRAGTSLAAAAVLDEIAAQVSADAAAEAGGEPIAALPLVIRGGRLNRITALPEAQIRRIRTSRGGASRLVAIDEAALLSDWLSGLSVPGLAARYLHDVPDEEFRLEQLADHVTAAYENFLPWAVGIVIEWANLALADGDTGIQLDTSLPAFIRYGVDSMTAVSLVRAGIPSRSLATAVAGAFLAERHDPEQALRAWLCTFDLIDWRDRYHPSPAELRALIEFARPPGSRLAARLLGGEVVTVPVRTLAAVGERSAADIQEIAGEPAPARLGVWVGADRVAAILPEHYAEIEAVRATGVPLAVDVGPGGEGLTVSISLVSLAD